VKAAPFISSLNVLAVDGIDKVGLAVTSPSKFLTPTSRKNLSITVNRLARLDRLRLPAENPRRMTSRPVAVVATTTILTT
jgi:hypothetical protein